VAILSLQSFLALDTVIGSARLGSSSSSSSSSRQMDALKVQDQHFIREALNSPLFFSSFFSPQI
jgi:hypothetical protein